MSLQTDYDLIANRDFKNRVIAAIFRAAGDIRNQTEDLPLNHEQRLDWANSVLDLGEADKVAGWMIPLIVGDSGDVRFAFENGANGFPAGDQQAVGDGSIIPGVDGKIDLYVAAYFTPES